SWILDAATGASEGPARLPCPPLDGPIANGDGAVAHLRDGSLAVWQKSATPEILAPRELGPEHARVQKDLADAGPFGVRGDLVVLRRRTDSATRLELPGGAWSAEIADPMYLVKRRGEDRAVFAIARQGDWIYL